MAAVDEARLMAHYDSPEQLPERFRDQVRRADAARMARKRQADELADAIGARRLAVSSPLLDSPASDCATFDGHALTVTLGLRAWGVNEERAQHWTKHRARTRAARDYARLALADQRMPGFVERVEIECTSYGTRLDPLSDAPVFKAAVDALRDLGVLADDASRNVARYVMNAPVKDGPDRIVLVVRPAAISAHRVPE